jgi:ribA/ribD-fused uncharacterized protein
MICFWSQSEHRIFSNFTPVQLDLDGQVWSSVEHYYQAQKFLDPKRQEEIRLAASGGKTKRLARKYATEIRPDWDQIKVQVMTKALRAKYYQEPFTTALLATGTQEILEDSPKDLFWGTGQLGGVGPGQNTMGQLLMQLRAELNKNLNE